MAYLGKDRLKMRLEGKRGRVNLRYSYYEMKNYPRTFNVVIPQKYTYMLRHLGWCSRAVDVLADRLVFTEFERDFYGMNDIFRMNSQDVLTDSAILAALISGCSFVYVSEGDNGEPRLQCIDGGNATGIMDPITRMLKEGYAVLERDPENGQPTVEAWFTPEETVIYRSGEKTPQRIENPAPYPLLVPVVNRPDARRPFGHSRITRTGMDLQDEAINTLFRAEIAGEFYSFPQKYVLGLAQDTEFEPRSASVSSFLYFTTDENGQHPQVGQFNSVSMTPFSEHMRTVAGQFAADAGLTLDDIGFPSDNPTSAESIKASHEGLRLIARKAQRDFEIAFLNVGYLAACLRDKEPYARNQVYATKVLWEPIFELDTNAIGMLGDAAIKLNQAVPGYINEKTLRTFTGIRGDES